MNSLCLSLLTISDWFTNNWYIVVASIGGATGLWYIIKFVATILLTKWKAKILKGANNQFDEALNKVKNDVLELKDFVVKVIPEQNKEQFDNYVNAVDKKFNTMFLEFEKNKKDIYNKILNKQVKTQTVVEIPKVETTPKNDIVEPIVEEPTQIIEEQPKQEDVIENITETNEIKEETTQEDVIIAKIVEE